MIRKRRTRQHVIADLGVNHVERQVLLTGFAVDRVQHDYGIDLYVYTYDSVGGIENGDIRVQVKSTDRLRLLSDHQTVAVRIARADAMRWLGELMPVMLVVYDAQQDVAYWTYVQSYFASRAGSVSQGSSATLTIHLAASDLLDPATFMRLAALKNGLAVGVRHGG